MTITFVAPAAWLQATAPTLLEQISARRILEALLILLVAWLLIRWSAQALELLSRPAARARLFFKRLEPVLRITFWFVALTLAFNVLAPSREAFLAAMASIGIALGLGAQDLVKSVIGGLVILADRPYQLGDRVKIGDAYGEIDHIGLRSTKLTTPDDTRVTIPNAAVLEGQVFDANSGALDCQVVTELFLPADSDPVEVQQIAREAAYSSPYLLAGKPVVVNVSDHFTEAPFLNLRVKAYVYDHRFENQMKSDITIRAKTEFRRRGLLAAWGAWGRPQ
jgi:small-conductance mechanosensitive channel